MTKAEWRRHMKGLLAAVPAADLERRSTLAAERLMASAWWREADTVLAYLAMPGELDTGAIVRAARGGGKTVACPLIAEGYLRFRVIAAPVDHLARDAWGIPQPDPSWPAWQVEAVAGSVLVVTPGLAFDQGLHRLGRGRGYYDRFLARLRAAPGVRSVAVAFCLDEQVVDDLPRDDRDQPVDGIVTDRRTLTVAAGSP